MIGNHKKRIRQELISAGVTPYGLTKYEARHLHNIIESDETIGGVVYGQVEGMESAFLVATSKRVIFLDRKPLYSNMDELTYDVVSGVNISIAANRASVILHTRVRDYSMRFVRVNCARKFARFIDRKKQEILSKPEQLTKQNLKTVNSLSINQEKIIDPEAYNFLKNNEIAVLSTISRGGSVHGSVVYYLINNQDKIFILTQSESHKAQNLLANPHISLTVYEHNTLKSAQIQGTAQIINDQKLINDLFANAVKVRNFRQSKYISPVTKLNMGKFVAIMITPTKCSYHNYSV